MHMQAMPTLVEIGSAGDAAAGTDVGQQADESAEAVEQDEFDLAELMAEEIEVMLFLIVYQTVRVPCRVLETVRWLMQPHGPAGHVFCTIAVIHAGAAEPAIAAAAAASPSAMHVSAAGGGVIERCAMQGPSGAWRQDNCGAARDEL